MSTEAPEKVFSENLVKARGYCKKFSDNLPNEVDIAALGVWSKAPYKALAIRESLIWRTEELGRNACAAFEHGDMATGVLLTRAIVESAALIWRLRKVIRDRKSFSKHDLDDLLTKMLMGWKSDAAFPVAFNILTLVDALDKEVKGVRSAYDAMSEIAHPNYRGVQELFAKIDYENFKTSFEKNPRGVRPVVGTSFALTASLGLFEMAYNNISDEMPIWLAELSPLSGPRDPD